MQPHLVTGPPFRRQCRAPIDLARVAILVDVDGTILDVAATPQGVVVPVSLVRTLRELHAQTNGALALISGRLIERGSRPSAARYIWQHHPRRDADVLRSQAA